MKSSIYGLDSTYQNSKVIFIPIPWDVTTSYQDGASKGPTAILEASKQIDLFDLDYCDPEKSGIHMLTEKKWIKTLNKKMRLLAIPLLKQEKIKMTAELKKNLNEINKASLKINKYVYEECLTQLELNKIPICIGGDHSIPFGSIQAQATKHQEFGILHLDAHFDLRKSFMGFTHSHASIMYNVIDKVPEVSRVVQIGIRDFCEEEYNFALANKKIITFFDQQIKRDIMKGFSFLTTAKKIVSQLPQKVYLSFDIDGLDPKYCPNTGTPVPGGLSFDQVSLVLKLIAKSKRTIIGADLVEVSPGKNDEWDANVGMRLLYKMIGATLSSQKIIKCKKD